MDKHTNLKGMVSRYKKNPQWTNNWEWYPDIKTPTMDKHTNLKGMVSRYKNPTMDKHTNLKGMVSRYKKNHNGQTY